MAAAAGVVAAELRRLGLELDTMWAPRRRRRLPGAVDNLLFSAAVGWRARRRDYDLVHAHTSAGWLAYRLAPRRTARVMTSHGDERALWQVERRRSAQGRHRLRPWSRLLVPATRLPQFEGALRRADVVIALHDQEAASFRARRRAPADTVVVVPNGCRLPARPGVARRGALAFVGTWIWRKGSRQIAEGLRAARRVDPSLTLTLAGPDASALADFAPEDRASVRALGQLDAGELAAVLRASDALLLPSAFEGMPLAALDAMAWGVPVIGTDLPGIRAAVGEGGVLVAVDDAEALAAAILDVVGDRERRARLGAAARRRAAELSWDRAGRAVAQAYATARRIASARAGVEREPGRRAEAPGASR